MSRAFCVDGEGFVGPDWKDGRDSQRVQRGMIGSMLIYEWGP